MADYGDDSRTSTLTDHGDDSRTSTLTDHGDDSRTSTLVDLDTENEMLSPPSRDATVTESTTPAGKMQVKVKVLSLNIWGLVGVSKHRRQRVNALAEQLSLKETDFDYVFLQEVWSGADFSRIVEATKTVLPYSHYFFSGVTGSGVCLLSKWPIIDIFSFKYNLNGYAHKFYHGDWFGGKVVGMAKVQHGNLVANLYVTHLHAEYNRLKDAYLYHRVAQAFEFSQFVSHTMLGSCDYAIVAGDFNTQPTDLPYQIILYNSRLRDAFEEKRSYVGDSVVGATCGHPHNSFTLKSDLKANPQGQRIDYVMYASGTDLVRVACERYASPVWKTQSGVSVSDHEPVVAVLRVEKRAVCGGDNADRLGSPDPMVYVNFLNDNRLQSRIDCLENCAQLMDVTLESLRSSRLYFFVVGCLLFVVLLLSIPVDFYVYGTYVVLLHVVRIALTLLIGFCLLMGFLWNSMERSSVLSVKQSIDSLLTFLRVQFRQTHVRPPKEQTSLLSDT